MALSGTAPEDRQGTNPMHLWLLLGITLLAALLRFWRLGDYSFEATEMFTLRDSHTPQFHNSRPLQYLLNYFLVRPFLPLDEFGLRVLPAVFGVLAVPALYLISSRLLGARTALFASLLLAVSPLHVFYSQFARYWSLVMLLCAVYPYALFLGIRNRSSGMLALGFSMGALAALAHPVSLLLLGGMGIWFVASYVRPSYLAQAWNQRSVRWGTLVAVVLLVVIAIRFVPMLQNWITQHDKAPGTGQFLVSTPGGPGVKQIFYILAFIESLTVPLVLAAVLGAVLMWQRDRSLTLFLVCIAIFPVAFLALLSLRTPVSTYYLVPSLPAFYIGAGFFLGRLSMLSWELRPRWLLTAGVTAIIIAAGMPTLISQYLNGRRYEFRGVAHWLNASLRQGDVVYSDQPMVLAHYLAGTKVNHLRGDPGRLMQAVREQQQSGGRQSLWIVMPAPSHALRGRQKVGRLNQWIYDYCRLRNTVGIGTLDLRQQYLQVYRCSVQQAEPQSSAASIAAPTSP